MGRKKRVKPSSSCSAPAAAVGVKAAFPSASSLSHGSPNKEAKKAAEMEAIKLDCDRAFDAFRRGNHHKALKLMKKFCSSYPNSGFVHTLQGTMYYQLALTIADSSTKLQYLKTAADSASRATLLSPEKMDSAHFFAHLLYLTSEKNDGYQEVVRECERALSIPVEKASLLVGRNQLEGSILMAQISELQEGLRSLIGMSNETMNNGVHLDLEAKFMLVPFSDLLKESKLLSLKYSEDGMELKDLEEREKEIEAKIQKTKLLENLRVLPEWQTEEASLQNYLKDGVPESSSRSSYKQEKIKRVSNLKKMKESARMMPYVVMYWDSISFDQKRRLLNVRIGDLIEYFGSNEYVEEALIFCEAMSFAKDNKSWKFLGCCFCSQRFKELIPYLKHLEVQHLRNVKVLAPEMMSMLPLELNSYWVDMLLKDRWKPVDTSAALKMIESGPKGELSCTVGGDRESHGGEVGGDQNIKEVDGEKGLPDAFPFDHNWPLSYDSERAGILSKIHIMFKLFFRHNYLSERLLKVLIKYSLEKLQTLVPELEPLIQGLDQTPLCLCFLQVPQLRYVYSYLEDLVRLCRLDFRSEKDGSVAETPRGGFDIKHRIGLSSESVSLLLDKHSNRGAVDFFTYHDNISADASSVAFTVDNLEDDALPGSDSLAAWIFGGPSNEQQLTSWARALQEKKHQAIDILSILEKEFPEYKSLCDSKCIHLRQEEAFQAVENILAEEFTKRRENLEFVPQGYEVLLKKRQEELARTSNDVFGSDAAEFTFISKVLKEVEALSLRVAGGTSHLSDQESDQEDESKTFEDLLEQDSLLEMAVQDQKEEVSLKLCEIDTSLMRCVGVMRNLQSKLGKISVIDYRSILWVILTSFLRDHLEDLARKYATEKSDAVGRALLLEAALDTQKNINTADDNTKKTQKKSKKKKKNKSSRDAKDSKATGGIKQLLISDSPKSETAAGLKQQEEESRPHELELQAQETRLEEQYQGLPGGRTSEDSVLSPDQRGSQCTFDDMNASDVHGTSLKKSLAQYDCFLDVIITSLWHLRWFRFELQRRREIPHAHAGNPCVFCSLCNTFTVLSLSPVCWKKDVVAPCLAKMALSDLYPDNIFFQEAQTNDVISILVGIFECLHQSFSAPGEKYSGENWDCTSDECLAHTIIGMNLLERISCCYCGLESGNEQFTSFLRMVDESKLRRMKDTYMDSSFDKLLKLVNASSLFPCDPEAGGCGKLNPTQHFLSSPPHVFITVIDRKNGHERGADISTTLAALSTKIDLGILYEGLDEGNTHYLISLVCFTGKNYRCFAYRHEVEKWIMLDDEECKVIGCWNDVITVCRTRNLQPLILFFEDEMQIF
eukprot:XP_019080566.1 PREDICTED: uncharacterized protein LOC104881683 isoform X5 [Vitis vinifera]